MLQPSPLAASIGVVVRPMDDATSVIPLILAPKGDLVTLSEVGNPRRQVDVVTDEQGLA